MVTRQNNEGLRNRIPGFFIIHPMHKNPYNLDFQQVLFFLYLGEIQKVISGQTTGHNLVSPLSVL